MSEADEDGRDIELNNPVCFSSSAAGCDSGSLVDGALSCVAENKLDGGWVEGWNEDGVNACVVVDVPNNGAVLVAPVPDADVEGEPKLGFAKREVPALAGCDTFRKEKAP